MNKLRTGLALTLVVLSIASLALASSVPSKTTSDLVKPVGIVSATGEAVPVTITLPSAEQSQAATEELAAIATFMQKPGATLVSYFDAAVQQEMTALLPEGFDTSKLVMNEFVPLALGDYKAEYGDLVISFEFATEYADGEAIVAMVGIKEGSLITWYPQKAAVVDGIVQITFTQDVLEKMQTGEVMLAILSGAAA